MRFGNVSRAKQEALKRKMQSLGIREEDIEEKFVRASGKGGQKVNKTSTCVYLKHLPTGIEVKYMRERSQALNRFLARRVLVSKLEMLKLGELAEERKKIDKIRKQKRRRSRRAKEKILKYKRERAEKKRARSYRPESEEWLG